MMPRASSFSDALFHRPTHTHEQLQWTHRRDKRQRRETRRRSRERERERETIGPVGLASREQQHHARRVCGLDPHLVAVGSVASVAADAREPCRDASVQVVGDGRSAQGEGERWIRQVASRGRQHQEREEE